MKIEGCLFCLLGALVKNTLHTAQPRAPSQVPPVLSVLCAIAKAIFVLGGLTRSLRTSIIRQFLI
jgi:hypothetical protein